MKVPALAILVLLLPVVTRADHAVLEGEAAMAKLPASVRAMGLWHAKWTQVTNGVEYIFARFNKMYTYAVKSDALKAPQGVLQYGKDDLHIIRIDYRIAPVCMKMVESSPSTKRTSLAAKNVNALFGINGTFQCSKTPTGPQHFTKTDGRIVKGGNTYTSGDGIAFCNGSRAHKFGRAFTESNSTNWDSVITTEAYGLVNSNNILGASVTYWGRAPYTFIGEATNDVIYAFVVDGRSSDSVGMSYGTCCELMREFGCTEGMVFDGGGSTTMVFRKDMLPTETMAYTQKQSASASNYWVMNKPSDGSERAVINQLLFVALPGVYDWKSPDEMQGDSAGDRCEAALVADGVAPEIASRLADETLYGSFTEWAQNKLISPSQMTSGSPVILSAAFGADAIPDASNVALAIEKADSASVGEDGSMDFSLKVTSEAFDPSRVNAKLLKAALGVSGSSALDPSGFSADNLDLTFGDVSGGSVPVHVVPHAEAGTSPEAFFIRATAH